MIEQVVSPSDVYWITRCDSIKDMSGGLCIPLTIVLLLSSVFWVICTIERDNTKPLKIVSIMSGSLLSLMMLVYVLTPTTKEMCAIIVLPAVANNDGVQDIAVEVKTLATDWLKELRPEKKVENEPTGK